MSETVSQPNQPHIYGTVSPDEAKFLATADLEDPNAHAILERLGASGAERGYALVVGQGENGEDVASGYIDVRLNDLGTRIAPGHRADWGLPEDPKEAYDQMKAMQAEQPVEAVEAVAAQDAAVAEQAELVEEAEAAEPEAAEATPGSIDELAQNPDKLLHGDNLRTILDAPQSLATPDVASDQQKMADLNGLHHMAKREIVGPEAAARISSEIMQQTGHEVAERINVVDRLLSSADDQLAGMDRDGRMLMDELPQVKGAIRQLRDAISNPHYMRADDLGRLGYSLRNFVEQYDGWNRRHTAKSQQAVDGARNLRGTVNAAGESTHGAAGKHASITAEVRSNPSGIETDKVVQAVQQRGAGSIAEHQTSADTEVAQNNGVLQHTAASFGRLEENTGQLVGMLARTESEIRYPRTQQVGDIVEELGRYLRGVGEGNMGYARMADELLEQMQRVVGRIESTQSEESQAVRRMRALVDTMRGDVTRLKANGIGERR